MRKSREILEFFDELRDTDKMVIVEGVKDKKALEAIGVKRVYCLNKAPLYKIVEEIAGCGSRVIILTDLDSEGRRLYGKLKTQLQHLGVEVDNYFREFLFKNTKIRQVEGLSNGRSSLMSVVV